MATSQVSPSCRRWPQEDHRAITLRLGFVAKTAFNSSVPILDLSQLRVFPLSERRSLTQAEDILVDPKWAFRAVRGLAVRFGSPARANNLWR